MSKKPKAVPHPANFALDEDGGALPAYSPTAVADIINDIMEHGRVLCVIGESRSGDLAIEITGPPSRHTAEAILKAAIAMVAMHDRPRPHES